MAYDKKTGTITTNGDTKQLESDMFSHFANVQAQVNAELEKRDERSKQGAWLERLKSPSRPTKVSMVLFVVWTLYVFYRTWDYHELLGIDLQRWNSDYFFGNWLIIPTVIFALYKATKWALRRK